MQIDPTIITYLIPVATVAAAWGGAKQALNGTRERVKDINDKMDKHIITTTQNMTHLNERVAVVETKIDGLKERV